MYNNDNFFKVKNAKTFYSYKTLAFQGEFMELLNSVPWDFYVEENISSFYFNSANIITKVDMGLKYYSTVPFCTALYCTVLWVEGGAAMRWWEAGLETVSSWAQTLQLSSNWQLADPCPGLRSASGQLQVSLTARHRSLGHRPQVILSLSSVFRFIHSFIQGEF